ncbi:MAG: glycosyltransferase [Candidatus Staskawiczbacteria bacterium]|nr:glycosyltransferase [Candidatus Staskawiczbacteria bacterium]
MERKKVLVLHGKSGMGHTIVAKALLEVFSKKYPEVEIKDADAFDFLYWPLRQGYLYFYNNFVDKAPFLFKMLYDSYSNEIIRKFFERVALFFVKKPQFISFVKSFSPDFILATNPLPLQLTSLIEEKHIIDILSANVCTDFGFHSLWHSPDINYYFVANQGVKQSLVDCGVSPDKIKITGIPVRPEFYQPLNRNKILRDIGFNFLQPVLLILGGQLKYNDLLKVVLGIQKKNNLVQFIVIAGRDKNLQNKLENSELKKNTAVRIFGIVADMERFMEASDLILSKAGGSTVAECLAKALPMIVYKIIPGQEEDNVNYLIENGAGTKVESAKEVIKAVVDLFSRPEKLKKMKENCLKIQKPNSAEDIADFVISQI